MAVLASVHEMTHIGRSVATVVFQMILVTFHIFKKSMTLRTFDRGPIRSTRGIGQTKGATMRTGSTVFFNISVAHITVVAVVLILGDIRYGEDGIVMLIIV
jgi:hypothetical protein